MMTTRTNSALAPIPTAALRLSLALLVALGMLLSLLAPVAAQTSDPANLAETLSPVAGYAKEGKEYAEAGNAAKAQHEFDEVKESWSAIEDGVRDQNPQGYLQIELALDGVESALAQTPLDLAAVEAAFDHLLVEVDEVSVATGGMTASAVLESVTTADLVAALDQTQAAIASQDAPAALAGLSAAMRVWPAVEGVIAVRSPEAYTAMESGLAKAYATLEANPVDWAASATAVSGLQTIMAPLTERQTYTAFDAAAIILREGLEALLVVVALLAFLRRSNNQDKQRWIWAGAGAGILLSIVVAFLLQAAFSQISAGRNREIIEGVTGLVAAAMLFYVSYWLHSKSSLAGWQSYINTNTAKALARGNMFGLATLSFLAVFREGAETTVFYLGMAPSITLTNLVMGLVSGLLILAAIAVLILVFGVKIPMRPFFRIAGLLVFYLGFKFVGTGIHVLQVAGVIPATPIAFPPAIPFLGVYPAWETLLPQLLLLVITGVFLLYARNRQNQAAKLV